MKLRNAAGLALLLCSFHAAQGKTSWELKKDKEGIKVYTGTIAGSDIKAIKVECTVNARLSTLKALLLDAKAHEQWVYSTRSSYLVKKIGNDHLIYYSEMSMPWPITNRDMVVDLSISEDTVSKVLRVHAHTAEGYVAAKSGKVRVPASESSWTVRQLGKEQLRIEYVAQADPGGSVPAWAVNLFSTKGPFETFSKLRGILAARAAQEAQPELVKD